MTTLARLCAVAAATSIAAPSARAACDQLVAKADTSKGPALVASYQAVVQCDKDEAKRAFFRFMQSAADSELLTDLSMVAIEADIWNPVWEMIGKISDYNARDEVAANIGALCQEHGKVVGFLQGAYFGLRDIEFQQWDDALITCEAPAFGDWLTSTVEAPPPRLFDDKWDTIAKAYVQRMGVDALPSLGVAAVKAAENGGPFTAILVHMDASVAPELGADMEPEHQAALEGTLTSIAPNLPVEKALAVADRLNNAGATEAAAALLPRIYPDRVQPSGGFLYGAAAVETAECKGEKVATVHVAQVSENGSRYILQGVLEKPMRALKPRLDKCVPDTEKWPVIATSEPLESADSLDGFYETIARQWTEKGYEVKRRDEKPVVID